MPVTVKWGNERRVTLPPPDTPLAAVRKSLAEYTHLPHNAFKLIHAGAVMKDDAAPVSAYNLRPNSTIALIGATDPRATLTHAPPQSHSERAIIDTIAAELHVVRASLAPDLTHFERDPTNHKEHLRLGELLLQSLLRLDSITAEPAWEDARKRRKDAVREVQDMLDRLDTIWASAQPTP
ncbi:hypothetical protein DXG03_003176 [Asterophora parasitica]|uniref:BAG domain-containing protein n=1 Tax=Asterophora parasitica TaxID=117018 RepID=A0A9P7GJQ0_9AGAR|nr:hypothetical protein DXG03_003176 [Asterophora parasitica]